MNTSTTFLRTLRRLNSEEILDVLVKAHRGRHTDLRSEIPAHLIPEVRQRLDDFLAFLQDELPIGEPAPTIPAYPNVA